MPLRRKLSRKVTKWIMVLLIALCQPGYGQFVDITQVEPYSNPASVCAGGILTFRLNNLQNLNPGSIITMELSTAGGAFPGTVLTTIEWSTNNNTWTTGNYVWTANISNSYIRVSIPAGAAPGAGYTARARSSSPFVTGGNNNGGITITAPVVTIPTVAPAAQGLSQWFGHVYTWTPTVGGILSTPALVAAQNFYDPTNYKGHVVINNLSFDNNYGNNGIPFNLYDQTSIPCGQNWFSNASIRFKRREVFAPGRYTLSIQADDGARVSIDNGNTWLLNSFIEQQYSASLQTTATNNPSGICLGGPVDLVIEYFQRPAQARVTFNCTQVSASMVNPSDQNLCVGQTATFDATSTDPGVIYQWQYSTNGGSTFTPIPNGPPFSGIFGPVLTVSNVTQAMSGWIFKCFVTGSCPTPVFSLPAALTVSLGTTAFTQQPVPAALCVGDNGSFSVASNGSGPFQWMLSTNGGVSFSPVVAGGVFGNPTGNTLTLTSVGLPNNGSLFFCTTQGSCGSPISSDTVLLSVIPGNNSFTIQPPPTLNACVGGNASLSVATATASSITWLLSTDGGTTFTNLPNVPPYSGTSTTNLQITGITASMNGYIFVCSVFNCGGPLVTTNCTLNVVAGPAISQQPTTAGTLCPGNPFSFDVQATGATGYTWYVNTGSGFAPLGPPNSGGFTGINASTLLQTTAGAGMNGWSFFCLLSGACPQGISSDTVSLSVAAPPTYTAQPQNQVVCGTQTVSFVASASGNGISYQWQVSTDGGVTFSPLTNGGIYSGASTPTLTVTGATSSFWFQCIATDVCGNSLISQIAGLTLQGSGPLYSAEPVDQTVCLGDSSLFLINAAPGSAAQWWMLGPGQSSATPVGSGGVVSGTGSLHFLATTMAQSGSSFFCILTDACGSRDTTLSAILTLQKPTITLEPTDQFLCLGSGGSFTIQTAQANAFQWQMWVNGLWTNISDGALFVGSNSPNLAVVITTLVEDGLQVRCIASGSCPGSDTSAVATLQISTEPILQSTADTLSICKGANATLQMQANGQGLTYLWFVSNDRGNTFFPLQNSSRISGATTSTLTLKNIREDEDGWLLRCVVSGCNTSSTGAPTLLDMVQPALSLFIPTGFSPNQDGRNEEFTVHASDPISLEGYIYNRWGERVFSFSDGARAWDGTYKGTTVPAGVYVYSIKATGTCAEEERNGHIQVLY
jgi:gliding motility-associated-like protein